MPRHIPVLLPSVMELLEPAPGETVLDVTLGLGGHAEVFLDAIGPRGRLIALDADAGNLALARERLGSHDERITLIHANFRDVPLLDLPAADIVFADLGLSSPHLDEPERGFSFRFEGPLDLRFDRSRGKTASEFLHAAKEEELIRVFAEYGELREARRLGKALYAEARQSTPQCPVLSTTADLKNACDRLFGFRSPALLPQVFQALRIAVNDEINALETLLAAMPERLENGGRMAVIAYHSLEDRLVKSAFRRLVTPRKDEQTGREIAPAPFRLLTKKPIMPPQEEIQANPRARSARLRVLERVG